MISVVLTNQKGGVGKTTLTRELGLYLATLGYKVLLIDADPQGNLTKSLTEEGPGLYEALSAEGLELERLAENLSLLKGTKKLSLLAKQLLGEFDPYVKFKELFTVEEIQGFDLLLLDTPPSLGTLTINALTACDHVLVPTSCALYSLQGTNDLLDTVAKVRKRLNPDLSIVGVVVNAYEPKPIITRQIRAEIEESFDSLLFSTVLSKSIKLEEAVAAGGSVLADRRKEAVKIQDEVRAIGDELLKRLGVRSRSERSSEQARHIGEKHGQRPVK